MKLSTSAEKRQMSGELYIILLLVVIFAFLYIVSPSFFKIQNIMSVLRVFSYVFISAIGMTMIIITGQIDISFGAIASVIAIVTAAMSKRGINIELYLPVGILIGMVLAGINGFITTKFRIHSIVVTLATTQIYFGALLLVVDGSIYGLGANWTWLSSRARLFNTLPLSVLVAFIILIFSMLFFRYSRFCKKLYAIGNNRQGAIYAGIDPDKMIIITFIIAGAFLGFSSLIIATIGTRVTCTMGTNLEMQAIAAVVVGGTNIMGGSGKIYGTALGALLLAIISSALVSLGINTVWTTLVTGLIIVIAVLLSASKEYVRMRKQTN